MFALVTGSESDLKAMAGAADVHRQLGGPRRVRVISAHRTPQKAHEFTMSAKERGIRVIIAGAEKASHLAGVLASLTRLPVISVLRSKWDGYFFPLYRRPGFGRLRDWSIRAVRIT